MTNSRCVETSFVTEKRLLWLNLVTCVLITRWCLLYFKGESGQQRANFSLPILCQFCWQLDPSEYRCSNSTNCMTVSCPRKRYNATCDVLDHVHCLGEMTPAWLLHLSVKHLWYVRSEELFSPSPDLQNGQFTSHSNWVLSLPTMVVLNYLFVYQLLTLLSSFFFLHAYTLNADDKNL